MIGSGIWNISARSWGRWGWPDSRQTRGSVQLGGWRYGIWASTWVMGRCVPKLTRRLQLRPARVPRPKRRWDSSRGWRVIIGGLFLIFRKIRKTKTKKNLCQQALTKVKAALCGGPLLHSPNFDLPFLLQTDASDRGLGAVLAQVVGGEERPVLYLSRKLSKRETRYSTVEKECLAIRWAVLTLRYYLLGREFTLCSDHAPLQWLHRMKDTNARITRWYLALQPFKFKVIHRPGVQMAVADFLSWNGGGGLQAGELTGLRRAVGGMWRGKAERARGRAGSETSGESVGNWIMINTCIWFQWLPGRLEKAPAGLQWGGSNEQRERESPTAEEEQNHHRRRAPEFCLRFWYSCFILCY